MPYNGHAHVGNDDVRPGRRDPLEGEPRAIAHAHALVQEGLRALKEEGIPLTGLRTAGGKRASKQYRAFLTLRAHASSSEEAKTALQGAEGVAWSVVYGRRQYIRDLLREDYLEQDADDIVHSAMLWAYQRLWRWQAGRPVAPLCYWALGRTLLSAEVDVIAVPESARKAQEPLLRVDTSVDLLIVNPWRRTNLRLDAHNLKVFMTEHLSEMERDVFTLMMARPGGAVRRAEVARKELNLRTRHDVGEHFDEAAKKLIEAGLCPGSWEGWAYRQLRGRTSGW